MEPVSRRTFLFAAAGFMAQPAVRPPVARPTRFSLPPQIVVRLDAQVPDARLEAVMFGVPLPPGALQDLSRVQLLDVKGQEIDASIRPLETWRIDGHDGSIRSIGVSLRADFSTKRSQAVRIVFNAPPRAHVGTLQPVSIEETLIDPSGLEGPRVRAVLPTGPMCASWIVGPQIPAVSSGLYKGYDRFVERSFPESLKYLDSDVYHHWLFDRPTVYYTQYVRTGDARFLDAAFHAAHFMRAHTVLDGSSDAGYFDLKGVDVKYVYPRAMHIHYLLTGDERALEAGKTMARFCLTHWDPVYRPERYVMPPLGTDPEKDRLFWSPRHQAYGLLGVLHGWEMTGDRIYWDKAREYIDALDAHQRQPPDGHPPDGSFRQNWALYDPNETLLEGGTSPWMMAILADALYQAWLLTGDERIPPMIVRWCDFLDRKGFVPDGSRAYYIVDCLGDKSVDEAPGPQEQGVERHSTELAMTLAMGLYFSQDARLSARFRRRFNQVFAKAVTIDANRPVRAYNWAFQASSRLVYFMKTVDARSRPAPSRPVGPIRNPAIRPDVM